jgi:hypothetical protein
VLFCCKNEVQYKLWVEALREFPSCYQTLGPAKNMSFLQEKESAKTEDKNTLS